MKRGSEYCKHWAKSNSTTSLSFLFVLWDCLGLSVWLALTRLGEASGAPFGLTTPKYESQCWKREPATRDDPTAQPYTQANGRLMGRMCYNIYQNLLADQNSTSFAFVHCFFSISCQNFCFPSSFRTASTPIHLTHGIAAVAAHHSANQVGQVRHSILQPPGDIHKFCKCHFFLHRDGGVTKDIQKTCCSIPGLQKRRVIITETNKTT